MGKAWCWLVLLTAASALVHDVASSSDVDEEKVWRRDADADGQPGYEQKAKSLIRRDVNIEDDDDDYDDDDEFDSESFEVVIWSPEEEEESPEEEEESPEEEEESPEEEEESPEEEEESPEEEEESPEVTEETPELPKESPEVTEESVSTNSPAKIAIESTEKESSVPDEASSATSGDTAIWVWVLSAILATAILNTAFMFLCWKLRAARSPAVGRRMDDGQEMTGPVGQTFGDLNRIQRGPEPLPRPEAEANFGGFVGKETSTAGSPLYNVVYDHVTNRPRPEWTGLNRAASDRTGLNRAAPDRTGLNRAASDRNGMQPEYANLMGSR